MAFPTDPNFESWKDRRENAPGFGLPRDAWGRVILPSDDGYAGERYVRLAEDAAAVADADAAIREYAEQGISWLEAYANKAGGWHA